MTITYKQGDVTRPEANGTGEHYIIHVCNNRGGWGRGVVLAISARWFEPERAYREWFRVQEHPIYGTFQLGNIQNIQVEQNLNVINMLAQNGYGKNNTNLHYSSKEPNAKPPLSYEALEQCLTKVANIVRTSESRTIHMPRIGTGLGGASWVQIEPIILRTLGGLDVTVYDL